MASRPKAKSDVAAVVDAAVAFALGHPGTTFLVGLAVVFALQQLGVLGPLDWWGAREVGR